MQQQTESSPSVLDWRVVAEAVMHPTQLAIVRELDGVVRSPRQIANAIGVELSTVSHHVRMLAHRRAIVLVREQRRRGGMQHFYALATDERDVDRAA